MTMDRELWVRPFADFPHLPCPKCKHGRLNKVDKTEQHLAPIWAAEADDPDVPIYDRFILFAQCADRKCGEVVSVAGTYTTTGSIIVDIHTGDSKPEEAYYPACMAPCPPMIVIPEAVPNEVKDALKLAFQAFWSDLDGCISKLRGAVEKLLDSNGVPRKTPKGSFLVLGARLSLFTHPNLKPSWLDALRKVGNLGTHGEVGEEDVFNAMDMFEIVLKEAYGEDSKARADALAKLLDK